jgi:hypothetical protein
LRSANLQLYLKERELLLEKISVGERGKGEWEKDKKVKA